MSRETLGEALRAAREGVGLTQADVAKASGVDFTYVSHIESGRRRPSKALLVRMLAALGVGRDVLEYVEGVLEPVEDGPVSSAMEAYVVSVLSLPSSDD